MANDEKEPFYGLAEGLNRRERVISKTGQWTGTRGFMGIIKSFVR